MPNPQDLPPNLTPTPSTSCRHPSFLPCYDQNGLVMALVQCRYCQSQFTMAQLAQLDEQDPIVTYQSLLDWRQHHARALFGDERTRSHKPTNALMASSDPKSPIMAHKSSSPSSNQLPDHLL